MNLEVDKRAAWVRNLVKKTGTKGIVIGLSGGKDSAYLKRISMNENVFGSNIFKHQILLLAIILHEVA